MIGYSKELISEFNFNLNWYKVALRKDILRVDLKIYPGETEQFNNPNDLDITIKSIISESIIKGLDVIGIVSTHGPEVGVKAKEIAKSNQYDIWVIGGQEYSTVDKINLIVYNLSQPLPPNLDYNGLISFARKNKAFVMITQMGKRQAHNINKLKNTEQSPNAVEIYSGTKGAFRDLSLDYPKFITSGATSSKELAKINSYTLISRKEFEGMGLMPEGEGSDYLPNYIRQGVPELQQPNNIEQGDNNGEIL